MAYKIYYLRNYYANQIGGSINWHAEADAEGRETEFESLAEAQAALDEITSGPTHLGHGECAAPDFVIVDAAGGPPQPDELDGYDWSECDCSEGYDESACGECDECLGLMRAQNLAIGQDADLSKEV